VIAARLLACALLALAPALAQALGVAELQQLLQAGAHPDVRYQESRESPWLSAPGVTEGVLHATPQLLEKRVASPRRETWRLLPDRLEWAGVDGSRKQVLFKDAPALQALADVTRQAVAGDLAGLQRDFTIAVQGSREAWSARLQPRGGLLQRQLESVQLQGAGSRLQVLIVTERAGERTTTRLLY
jgi:hypothetical protein